MRFDFLPMLAGALLLEAAFGYPDPVFRAIGHPVAWAGTAIAWLDRVLNRRWRRAAGVLALCILLLVVGGPAWAVQAAVLGALPRPAALALLAAAASALLAQRSLWRHVRAVEHGLRAGLAEGREAVAHIVGRNPASLDAHGVARAAIESLAENFADGVVAPALWCAVAGLPGIALYKAINTADSMIGHRTPRHAAFGWAAARLDDLVNLPASRLAALLLLAAAVLQPSEHRPTERGQRSGSEARQNEDGASGRRGMDAAAGWRALWRDAGRHRSPNAGWPEAAMAGALGLRLAGPRVYGAERVDDAWMGAGRAEAGPDDIARALALYRTACAIGVAAVVAAAAI